MRALTAAGGSLLAFDLATPAPTSTAATEALTELTELLEVHTGACTAQRRRRRSLRRAPTAAEGRLDAALVTLERATRHLAAAQREQEESVRAPSPRGRAPHHQS